MPLFKLLSGNRAKKVLIRATTVDEIISEAKLKFYLADNGKYKVNYFQICKKDFYVFLQCLIFGILYFYYLGCRGRRWDGNWRRRNFIRKRSRSITHEQKTGTNGTSRRCILGRKRIPFS